MRSSGKKQRTKSRGHPVLAARVPWDFYEKVQASAVVSGRNASEELIWRAEQSYAWEEAHKSVEELLAKTKRIVSENLKTQLQIELRQQGYTPIRTIEGLIWFSPGMNALAWLFTNAVDRTVLQEMLDLAADRAIEKNKEV
jgi:hypothetical protein